MRLLFYGINYYPELTGIGKYTGEACEWLAQQGHEVAIITTIPYYPAWHISDEYKGKLWHTQNIEGVKVHRCLIYVPKQVTSIKRILLDISFILSSSIYWLKTLFIRKHDIVICICPPFLLGFFPLIYKILKGVPFVYHIQDLQVDIADELKMIKNKGVLKVLYTLERFLMNKSSLITSISGGMIHKIKSKQLLHNSVFLFPNWVDTEFITPLSKEQSLRKKLGLDFDDFIVLYSGNMGEKQGLEIIIQAAENLKHIPSLKFVMVGEGSNKAKLMELSTLKRLNNIFFFPLQPYLDLPSLLATADIHLVLQKKSASDLILPSKLTGILSAGGVAICTASKGSFLYDEVKKHNIGMVIEPENGIVLSDAVLTLMRDTRISSVYRNNAIQYAKKFLDKTVILSHFENMLLNLSSN